MPSDPADVKAANALQDQIKSTQAAAGKFEVPEWDKVSQDKVREALLVLAANSGFTNEEGFGAERAGRSRCAPASLPQLAGEEIPVRQLSTHLVRQSRTTAAPSISSM